MESVGVLLVAGGSGTRMGSNIPKQFIICQNKPIIQLTIERFFNWNPTIKLVLVLPENQIDPGKIQQNRKVILLIIRFVKEEKNALIR